MKKTAALRIQIGGDHYRHRAIQPVEFCHANRIPKLEGDIVYYVVRWRDKNGLEDLKKAIHSLQLLIGLEFGITVEVKYAPAKKNKKTRRRRR